jgi:DNA-binding transcriptional regulator YdaS (Cro superfamily)
MELKTYLDGLTPDEREALAIASGTTLGHLRNVSYGTRSAAPELAVAIERETNGAVMRWDLRPDDWRLIWPELLKRKDSPKPEKAGA